MSRRATRDDDESGSEDSDPELIETVERERRGSTGTTSQRAGLMDSYVLRMVDDDDKNDMRYLYEAMDHAKMELQQSLPRDYKKWWKIIDHRWENTLHYDLHATGYFLNPRLMYADDAHVDSEVLHGTLNVIGRLFMTLEKRLEVELQVREDIDDPIFDFTDTMWAEGILYGDEPRDLEFKVPAKRPRESSSKGKQPEIVEDTEE
ncbi:hypothetical protein Taro_045430 [Colocasia esculenta]|uniref:Uncharacterized protein n=1 Tax=Colocasia esculenta TaxID=4460 RepID=A0A843X2R8_COLES|nr:hypothetical protein [Colocasia esculenta]